MKNKKNLLNGLAYKIIKPLNRLTRDRLFLLSPDKKEISESIKKLRIISERDISELILEGYYFRNIKNDQSIIKFIDGLLKDRYNDIMFKYIISTNDIDELITEKYELKLKINNNELSPKVTMYDIWKKIEIDSSELTV